ncbi:MAG: DsbA family protein [Gammaproteobacteria bacterium]|nr:DsbA family protein [Gammaproteobacteria bacterium]
MRPAARRALFAAIAALAGVMTQGAFGGAARAAVPELQQVTAAGRRAILTPPVMRAAGGRHADITIVEYFDYNCPFCRRVAPTLAQLLAGDRKIALIYKDWPILGAPSVYAARSALAARWQGKYLVAHDALLDGARLTGDEQIDAILRRAGIDMPRLKKDLAAHSAEITAALARNDAEARALELDGTPGIIVGSTILPGIVDLGFFKRLVAAERASGPSTAK